MRDIYLMKQTNNSHIIFSKLQLYKTFFQDNKCYVSTTTDMPDIYYLDSIAEENDKIILINEIQDNELYDKSYNCNGLFKIELDNLEHVYVQKYIFKSPEGNSTKSTDLLEIRDENCKYSHFLANLIVEHYYINHMSFEDISHLLKLNYNLNIDPRRVCDLYYKTVDSFIIKKIEDVKEDIRNGNIKLGQVANYDEEFVRQDRISFSIISVRTYSQSLLCGIFPDETINLVID